MLWWFDISDVRFLPHRWSRPLFALSRWHFFTRNIPRYHHRTALHRLSYHLGQSRTHYNSNTYSHLKKNRMKILHQYHGDWLAFVTHLVASCWVLSWNRQGIRISHRDTWHAECSHYRCNLLLCMNSYSWRKNSFRSNEVIKLLFSSEETVQLFVISSKLFKVHSKFFSA